MRTAVAEVRLTSRPLALAAALHEAFELVTGTQADGTRGRLVHDLSARRGTAPAEVIDAEKPCLPQLSRAERHPLVDLREGWTFTDLLLEHGGTVATALDGGARVR
jgi:hypothetical protein